MSWGSIRPIVLTVIAAIVAFSNLDGVSLSALSNLPFLGLIAFILTFLSGVIGSLLIWSKKPACLWLSLFHQIMLIPVFWTTYGYWVVADVLQG